MSRYFGQNKNSWNTGEGYESHAGDGSGKIGILLFANALQVWSLMRGDSPSVADAAQEFNCDPDMIKEAIEEHAWMFLSGPDDDTTEQKIDHEGE